MHDAVARSGAPTSDDKSGGTHEEGFASTKGVINVAPKGPAYKPGDKELHITVPTTADSSLKVHVHPAGTGNVQVGQPPSSGPGQDLDRVDPSARPNMTNVVVGAGSGQVYIYNGEGVQATVPLKEFPKR